MDTLSDYDLAMVSFGGYFPSPQNIQEMARELLVYRNSNQHSVPTWHSEVKHEQ